MDGQTQKKTVLIVEDDSFLSDMYQTKFSVSGYNVLLAQNGMQCLELLRNNTSAPDIALLDVVMPKMDGLELLELLKKDDRTKNIPIILLTNLGQDKDVKKGMEMGADMYLIKAHYTPSQVVEKVEEILNNKSEARNPKS